MEMYKQTSKHAKTWRDYLPNYVSLYNVSYDSNLDNEHGILQRCVEKNNLYPLNEIVYDFWDAPEDYYMEDIRRSMMRNGLEDEYYKHGEEIKEYLWDKDDSTPCEDLIGNTTWLKFFYSTGIELDHGWHEAFMTTPWRNKTCAQSARRIRQVLGIKKDTPEADAILELCENSSCGGELRIYFEASVNDVIAGDAWESDKPDWKTIHFKGKCAVAVWDNTNGAGDFVKIELDKELPFVRENLQISDVAEKYDIDSVCGLCGDWLRDCTKPKFSYTKKPKRIKVSAAIKQEREFQKIFDAGGCSPYDNNTSRHRGVYYRNVLPCGLYCPNCGKIWYD